MLDYCYVFYRLHAVVCMDLKKKSMMVVVVGLVVSLVIGYIHNLTRKMVPIKGRASASFSSMLKL